MIRLKSEKLGKNGGRTAVETAMGAKDALIARAGRRAAMVDVLIAEDEPGILESLDFILRRAGWSISSVTDGEAVLEAVVRLKPRVLVLDVMLPKRSGFEVLKQIRAEERTRTIPVLVLTAKGQQHDRRVAEDLGASGFVTKPYANDEVVGAVRRLLGGG
jgi:two-component system, OmpR family, response regulator